MVVHDSVEAGRQRELVAKRGVEPDDAVAMFLAHLILAHIEVAHMLHADPARIGTLDPGRNLVHGPADGQGPIREGRQVLANSVEAPLDMAVFHALQESEVIVPLEGCVVRHPGVVVLDEFDTAADGLPAEPHPELCHVVKEKEFALLAHFGDRITYAARHIGATLF